MSADGQRIVRSPRRRRWTTIDNETIEDPRLSFKALGLLVYILSKPDHWRCNRDQLARSHAGGVAAVRSAMAELAAAGYVVRTRRRDPETGQLMWETLVSEAPAEAAASGRNPTSGDEQGITDESAGGPTGGKPDGGEPDVGKPDGGEPAALVSTDEVTTEEAIPDQGDSPERVAIEAPAGGKLFEVDALRPSTVTPEVWASLPPVVRASGHADAAAARCEQLARSLAERGYPVPAGITKRWLIDMEAILRIDGRDSEHVRRVIDWLTAGQDDVSGFWRTNVRSPANLRSNWARMAEQYQEQRARRRRPKPGTAAATLAAANQRADALSSGETSSAHAALAAWTGSTSLERDVIVTTEVER